MELSGWLRAEQAVVIATLLVVLASAAARLRRVKREALGSRLELGLLAGLTLAAVGARFALGPAMLHTNFHALGVYQNALDFPAPGEFRAPFGQTSYFLQGLACWIRGGAYEGVVEVTLIASVLAMLAAAVLAGRLAGPKARVATMALGVFLPLLARVGASEDAHNIGAAFGMLALVWADTARRAERVSALDGAGIVAATILTALSRQSLFVCWPPLVLVLALPSWRSLRRPGVLAGLAAYLALAGPHLAVMMSQSVDTFSYVGYFIAPVLFHHPIYFANHPLFWIGGTSALLAASAASLPGLRRRYGRLGVGLALGVVGFFVTTWAVSVTPLWTDGQYQRLALFVLLLPLAGAGGARVAERLAERVGPAALAALGVFALLAPLPGYLPLLEQPDPLYGEYVILRRHVRELEPGVARFHVAREPSYRVPPGLAPGPGVRLRGDTRVDTNEPIEADDDDSFVETTSCYAWAPVELCRSPGIDDLEGMRTRFGVEDVWDIPPLTERLVRDGVGLLEESGCRVPRGPRPECVALRQGRRFVRWGEVRVHRQQLPIVYWSAEQIPIGVWVPDEGPDEPVR